MCVFNVLLISHYQCCCSKKTFIATLSFLIFSDFINITLYTKCVKLKALFCNFTPFPIYCCSNLKYCFLSHYQCCCSKYNFSLRPFLSISLYTKCELYLFELYSLISHCQMLLLLRPLPRILIFVDSILCITLYNNCVHSI